MRLPREMEALKSVIIGDVEREASSQAAK